jgi:hypothetical protein
VHSDALKNIVALPKQLEGQHLEMILLPVMVSSSSDTTQQARGFLSKYGEKNSLKGARKSAPGEENEDC